MLQHLSGHAVNLTMQGKWDSAALLTNGGIIPNVNGVLVDVSDTRLWWVESENVPILYDKILNLVPLL